MAPSALAKLKSSLAHPLAKNLELEAPEAIGVHQQIILSKPVLRQVYEDWYRQLIPSVEATTHLPGKLIEIGCGPSFLEKFIPAIQKTDVVPHANVHAVVDAQSLPYADGDVRAIFGIDVLHHLPEPRRFLSEATRCLAPGGRLVLIEPSGSVLTRLIINTLHPQEIWDGSVEEWLNDCEGRLSRANAAMPWIIFQRDRKRFETLFPLLEIRRIWRHTVLAYYLSGGLSFRSLLPASVMPLLKLGDVLFRPLTLWLGTAMTIEIKKRA